ncbi:MAG: T9SS type A sorting domain-containing protein [Bacteroidetes bacterium]|nr:T9SS type A sorting domain-containing protein [Bacteroidota bacterium]MBU1719300.1 T9SS type A sorting domain-containing protein [Bacteroidota bacterium]
MKKLLLLLACSCAGVMTFAQSENKSIPEGFVLIANESQNTRTDALDFTVTSTDGVSLNLYTALNAGKTVLLDIFYTTCSYCIQYAPIIESSYQTWGAGAGSVYFWGIDNGDTDAQVIAYKSANGVSNPCASGTQGNGDAVITLYSNNFTFTGYPTYTVICPDKTVHWDVNYPPTATGFNTYFTQCGASSILSNPNISSEISSVYPNPATTTASLTIVASAGGDYSVRLYDIFGREVFSTSAVISDKGIYESQIPVSNLSDGVYFIRLYEGSNLVDNQKLIVSH